MPLTLGEHPDNKEIITLNSGRFGPYIAYNQQFFSLPNKEDIMTLNLEQALEIIAKGGNKKSDKPVNRAKAGPKKAAAKKAKK